MDHIWDISQTNTLRLCPPGPASPPRHQFLHLPRSAIPHDFGSHPTLLPLISSPIFTHPSLTSLLGAPLTQLPCSIPDFAHVNPSPSMQTITTCGMHVADGPKLSKPLKSAPIPYTPLLPTPPVHTSLPTDHPSQPCPLPHTIYSRTLIPDMLVHHHGCF